VTLRDRKRTAELTDCLKDMGMIEVVSHLIGQIERKDEFWSRKMLKIEIGGGL